MIHVTSVLMCVMISKCQSTMLYHTVSIKMFLQWFLDIFSGKIQSENDYEFTSIIHHIKV